MQRFAEQQDLVGS